MNQTILTLINDLKEKNEAQAQEIEELRKQKQYLSTTVFDNRITIRQLKEALDYYERKKAAWHTTQYRVL